MFDKLLTESFPGLLSIRNERHQIIYLNDNFRNWIKEYTDIDPIGKTNVELAKLVPKNVADTFMQCHDGSLELYEKMNQQKGFKKVIEFKGDDDKQQSSKYFDVFKYIVMVDDKPYIYTIAYDITSIYQENQLNLYFALTDSMTGVYNRRYLDQHFAQFIGHPAVLIDLDNFKRVNDEQGHTEGDKVLCEFVSILQSVNNCVAIIRLGGDEFLMVFSLEVDEKEIEVMIGKLQNKFEDMFERYQYLSFSYGIDRLDKSFQGSFSILDQKLYQKKYQRKHKV